MMHHLAVAVRALDPPGGGAERSLATLLRGVSVEGKGFDSSAKYLPLTPPPDLTSQLMQPWKISTLYSMDGGEKTNLLTNDITTTRSTIKSESYLSGLAWRLRSRYSGYPNSFFLKKHEIFVLHWFCRLPNMMDSNEFVEQNHVGIPYITPKNVCDA